MVSMHTHVALHKQAEIKFQTNSWITNSLKPVSLGEKMLLSTKLIVVGPFDFVGCTLSEIRVEKVSPPPRFKIDFKKWNKSNLMSERLTFIANNYISKRNVFCVIFKRCSNNQI